MNGGISLTQKGAPASLLQNIWCQPPRLSSQCLDDGSSPEVIPYHNILFGWFPLTHIPITLSVIHSPCVQECMGFLVRSSKAQSSGSMACWPGALHARQRPKLLPRMLGTYLTTHQRSKHVHSYPSLKNFKEVCVWK